MKKLICELCGGSDLVNDGTFFVCQTCGTKYTTEAARKMFVEVSDTGAAVAVAAPAAPVEVANTARVDNLMEMARNSFKSKNYADAERFCNDVIAIDVKRYDAWRLKAEAVNLQIRANNPRLEEVCTCLYQAWDCLDKDGQDELRGDMMDYIWDCLISEVNFWLDQVRDNRPTAANVNKVRDVHGDCWKKLQKFHTDLGVKYDYNRIFNRFNTNYIIKVNTTVADSYKNTVGYNYFRDAMSSKGKTWFDYRGLDRRSGYRPNHDTWETYINEMGHLATLCRYASAYALKQVNPDPVKVLYNNLIFLTEEPINTVSFKRMERTTTNGYGATLNRVEYWQEDYSLTDSAKESRRSSIATYTQKRDQAVADCQAYAKEWAEQDAAEKKKAIEAYWAEHAEEKERLDSRRDELVKESEVIRKKLDDIKAESERLQQVIAVPVPAKAELTRLQQEIGQMTTTLKSLGLFKNKEKKALSEQIAQLQAKIPALEAKAKEQTADLIKKYQPQIDELTERNTTTIAAANKLTAEIKNINNELNKDRR